MHVFFIARTFGDHFINAGIKKKKKLKFWNFLFFSPFLRQIFCIRLKSGWTGLPELHPITKHDNFKLIFHYQTVSGQKNILPDVYIFFWTFKPQTVLTKNLHKLMSHAWLVSICLHKVMLNSFSPFLHEEWIMQFEVILASCIIISDKLRYDLTNRENEKWSQIFALRWIGKDVSMHNFVISQKSC